MMKRILKSLVFVAVLLALSSTGSTVQAQIPELVIGIGTDADTLNPQEQTTSLMINMCELLYDTLFYQSPEDKLEPRLATKVDASKDGLTYTVHLRKDVKFSDGTPFDAKVMKLTVDRALDPKMSVPQRSQINMIKESKIVDDYTIELILSYPFAPFMPTLSMFILSPISPAAIQKYGQDVRQNPVGAGPYVLKEWVKGDRIVLDRNPTYYGKKPTVERLTFKIVPETATREAMLRSSQIDICYKPSPSNLAALKADANIAVDMPLDSRTIFMGLNYQKGVTKNKLVRQAFNYAVDKDAIVKKILFDTAVKMEGPCSPIMFGYHKMDKQWNYNPDKAKQLLKEANFDFNQTVAMRTPQGRYLFDKQVSEYVQACLQEIGVKVELRTYDWPTYVAGLLKPIDQSELEVFLLGWGPMVLDADLALYGMFHSVNNPPRGLGAAFYSSPEFDKAIEATRLEQDPKKRLELFKKAEEIVWDDCPWIWLHTEKFLIAYKSNLKGMVVTSKETFYPTYVTKK